LSAAADALCFEDVRRDEVLVFSCVVLIARATAKA
jgi:hypothetical protein